MPLTLTDMFCGCGGSSSGASAVNDVRVQLAMNHWRLAVDSHNHNHPDTDHDCADISETHPGRYALDLSLPGQRIGDRDRPLQPKTLARIEYGLKKYGLRHLVIRDMSTSGIGHRVRDAATAELPTQVGYGHGDSVLMPFLVETLYSHAPDDRARSGADVLPAQTTRASMAVALPFLQASRAGSPPHGVDGAMHTITTSTSGEYVVSPEPFIVPLRQHGVPRSVLEDLHTIAAGANHHMLIAPSALLTMRGSRHMGGLDETMPTQVAASIQNWIVSTAPFLTSYYGQAQAASVREAMGVVTTHDRHALAYAESLPVPSVEDLYFRMLQPHEMLAGQGFGTGYVVLGSKRDQVKQIGNANPPPTMQLLVERCVQSLAA